MEEGDALLLVDVIADFGHEDGEALLASFRRALPHLVDALRDARNAGVPVVYANDNFGSWTGDRGAVIRRARLRAADPSVLHTVLPREGDAFICKPRYSAFDHTPLALLLAELGTRRLLLAGTATEMCVAQTAIDAREEGFLVSVIPEACAAVDEGNAELALRYLERVVGVRIGVPAESR